MSLLEELFPDVESDPFQEILPVDEEFLECLTLGPWAEEVASEILTLFGENRAASIDRTYDEIDQAYLEGGSNKAGYLLRELAHIRAPLAILLSAITASRLTGGHKEDVELKAAAIAQAYREGGLAKVDLIRNFLK